MATGNTYTVDQADTLNESFAGSALSQRSNALANKLTSVLATSYADSEIRDAVRTLDDKTTKNTPEVRRRLRLDAQREVIDQNGEVVKDFGQVAEVYLSAWSR